MWLVRGRHYLTEVVRVSTVGGDFHSSNEDPFWTEADVLSRIPIITIQLPNDFKGKHFELFLNARLSSHNVEVALKHHMRFDVGYSVNQFVAEIVDGSIDYINATFQIKAYSWYRYGYGGNYGEGCTYLDLEYIVTA